MFRLALALGMTVGELVNRVGAGELDEWAAYYRLEPFGQWRDDHRSGVIAATVYNMNRGKNAKALGAEDFMPLIEKPPRPQVSANDLRSKLMAWLPPQKARPG